MNIKELEFRLYGLVPYNISPIQAAIQYGHAVQEFNNLMIDGKSNMQSVNFDNELLASNLATFNKWRTKDKTFIILNGGTTNESIDDKWYGSMQKCRNTLYENGILFAEFYEPDLNNTLTAIVFLVDERVWNRELYEDFVPETLPTSNLNPTENELLELENRNNINYNDWLKNIGGFKNEFLRKFLKNFRLANN
jgi:hypothetical protein